MHDQFEPLIEAVVRVQALERRHRRNERIVVTHGSRAATYRDRCDSWHRCCPAWHCRRTPPDSRPRSCAARVGASSTPLRVSIAAGIAPSCVVAPIRKSSAASGAMYSCSSGPSAYAGIANASTARTRTLGRNRMAAGQPITRRDRALAPAARQAAQPHLNLRLRSVRAQRRTLAPGARQTVQPIASLLSSLVRAQRRTLAPGARQAAQPIARFRAAHERSNATLPTNSGARAAPHARAGRAEGSSVACPEPPRAKSLGRTDRDLPMRWRTYESRPNGRVLSTGFSAIGPAPPSDPGQTRVSNRAPQAPRVPLTLGAEH